MRILFTIGDSYFPQRSGGAQSSTDQMAKALRARGHIVAVACMLTGGGWTEKRSRITRTLSRSKFSHDTFEGYSIYRAWDPSCLDEVVKRFKPDIAIVQNGLTIPMAKSLLDCNVPTSVFFRNVEFDELEGSPLELPDATFIANSEFTAKRIHDVYALESTVIRPLVDPKRYRTRTTMKNVTFINPYPIKGVDIAFAVAERCPDIPFVFVESWGIDSELQAHLDHRMASLPNVTLRSRTTDMKTVYDKARILLAPSRWEEAWGRVATEAQFCGIPVIGSKQGGLPEAIGPGGITIDIDADISEWVAAVRRLWDDDQEYERLSLIALDYSKRPKISTDHQINQLLQVMQDTIGHFRA